MSGLFTHFVFAGWLAIPLVLSAQGRPSQNGQQVRADRYGDPLPPGAIARLGTVRLRHEGEVNSVAISPDGTLVASASRVVKVWDIATGKEIERFKNKIAADIVAFSPDGMTLLTATGSQTIQHWEVMTGRLLHDTTPKQRNFSELFHGSTLFFSADRKVLVLGEYTGKIRLVDVATGKRLGEITQVQGLHGIALSRDGSLLALGDSNGFVHLHDIAAHKEIRRLGHGKGTINSSAYSPTTWVYAVQFSSDSQMLAAATPDALKLWDVRTGKQLLELPGRMGCPTFSPGDKILAVSKKDKIHLWDVTTGKEIRSLVGHGSWSMPALTFSRDGKLLAAGCRDHTVGLWDVGTGEPLHNFQGHRGAVISLAFSADGRSLASGGDEDHTLIAWDLSSHSARHFFTDHYAWVHCAAFSPDGKLIATGDGSNGRDDREAQIRLWDAKEGRLEKQFFGHLNSVQCLAFSPDGRTLASSGWNARTRLWDVTTTKRLHQIRGADSRKIVTFSPDGKALLVANGHEGGAELFEVSTGTKLRDVGSADQEYRQIHHAAFLPDGLKIVTIETRRVTVDETSSGRRPDQKDITEFCLWETKTGRKLRSLQLPLPEHYMNSFITSVDGKLLAVFGYNARSPATELWDMDSARLLAILRGHAGGIVSAAFSPDTKVLASGSWDTTVLLWDVPHIRLTGLWHQLNGDPVVSAIAAAKLTDTVDGAIRFLKERLQETARLESPYVRQIAELDSDLFMVREQALHQLEAAGPAAEFALRSALESPQSPEVRMRIRQALKKLIEPLEEKIERLIPDLDGENATAAYRQIEAMGRRAEPALRGVLARPATVDPRTGRSSLPHGARYFLQEALNQLEQPDISVLRFTPQGVRRALAVLERIGNSEARQALEELAKDPTYSRVTNEARAALRRLAGSGKTDGR